MDTKELLAIVFIVATIICSVTVHTQLPDYIVQSTNNAWSCGPARVKYWCYLYSAAVFMKLLSTGWTTGFLFGVRAEYFPNHVAFRGNKPVTANFVESNTLIRRKKDHLTCRMHKGHERRNCVNIQVNSSRHFSGANRRICGNEMSLNPVEQ
jgi:hypothetical protein